MYVHVESSQQNLLCMKSIHRLIRFPNSSTNYGSTTTSSVSISISLFVVIKYHQNSLFMTKICKYLTAFMDLLHKILQITPKQSMNHLTKHSHLNCVCYNLNVLVQLRCELSILKVFSCVCQKFLIILALETCTENETFYR